VAWPTGAVPFFFLLGAFVAQRLLELPVAYRHQRALVAAGARVVERDRFRLIVAVHVAFVAACVVEIETSKRAGLGAWTAPALVVFMVGQGLRWWARRTLGPMWTTRVVVLPSAPLVTSGPYRWLRHPNYAGVVLEMAALPVAFGLWWTAAGAVVAVLGVLASRVRVEERALGIAPRSPRPRT